jgi:hypothetical protein
LPVPRVEKFKRSKERERTKSGTEKKRSDSDKPRKKHSKLKHVLAVFSRNSPIRGKS